MDNQAFDLRDEILALYMPECPVGCNATAAELDVTRDELQLSCPDCGKVRTHKISAVPEIVFRILWADSVEPVEGIQ